MSLETTLKAIKDYGITGVLVVWLFMTNNRLSIVEQKLFDCYMTKHVSVGTTENVLLISEFLAILPSNPIGKIEHNV
jgi:hypothetical protein